MKLFKGSMLSMMAQIPVFPIEHALAGHHVGGQGKWGNCGPGCPIPPDDRLGPTTPFPKGKGRSPKKPIGLNPCFDCRQKNM